MKTQWQKMTALVVAGAMTMAVGCARPYARRDNTTRGLDGARAPGATRTPAPGGGTTGGGTTGGGTTGGGTTGGGTMGGGTTGARLGAITSPTIDHRDLGAQISASVASMDGMTAGMSGAMTGGTRGQMTGRPGGTGMAGHVGVSTLVIGNMAFVGIHAPAGATGMMGAGTTGVGTTGGAGTTGVGTTGGAGMGGGGMAGGTTGGAGAAGGTATDGAAPGAVGPSLRGGTAPGAGARGGTAPGTTTGADLHTRVRNHVRNTHPQITDVFVTTDPAMVSRIAQIGAEIQGRQSTVHRMPEIMAIAQTMAGQKR